MSTETEAQATSETATLQPAIVAPKDATVVVPPIVHEPAKPGAKIEMTSDEFKRRLDETRTKTRDDARLEFLKSFGVSDEAALKTAIAEQRRLEDEKRTDLEKRDVRIKDLEPKAARAAELETIVKSMADEQETALTPEQKVVVAQLAGDDPARRIGVIRALRSVLPAAPIATQQTPAKPAIAAGANTAPPPAPSPSGVTSPHIDHLATWDSLRASHPVLAAQYYLKHNAAIVAAQKARS